jgi:hypothetical protein
LMFSFFPSILTRSDFRNEEDPFCMSYFHMIESDNIYDLLINSPLSTLMICGSGLRI